MIKNLLLGQVFQLTMSLSYKRKREIDERNCISSLSRNKAVLGSQTKQIKSDSPQDTISTNYPGWITTEAALKLAHSPVTTLDRLATSRYKSSPSNKSDQVNDDSKNLQKQIFQSQVQDRGDQGGENLTRGVGLGTGNHGSAFENLGCLEETQTHNLTTRLDKKGQPVSIDNSSFDLEKELVSDLRGKISPKKDGNIRSDLISLDVTVSPTSTLNSEFSGSNVVETQVCSVNDSHGLDKEQNFMIGVFHSDYHTTLDNTAYQEKRSIQITKEIHFQSKKSEIDEYDEGINDNDFFAVISNAALPDYNQITTESNGGHAIINPSPCSFFSIASNKNEFKTSCLPIRAMNMGSKRFTDDEFNSPSDSKEFDNISEDSQTFENLEFSFDGKVLPQKTNAYSSKDTRVTNPRQIDWQPKNRAPSGIKDGFDDPFLTEEDWGFISGSDLEEMGGQFDPLMALSPKAKPDYEKMPANSGLSVTHSKTFTNKHTSNPIPPLTYPVLDDSHEYRDPGPFARPDFPALVRDSSPIIGLSSNYFLRVCFCIEEMIKEAERFNYSKMAPLTELFTRVTYSCREPGTCRQIFKFTDMWLNSKPLANGVLTNYEATDLIEQESREFIENKPKMLARVLGTLRRDKLHVSGWLLNIASIRKTDWEEINWTRKIVSSK